MSLNMPKAWSTPSKTKTAASTKVEARIDMSTEVAGAGMCPDCRKPMETVMAGAVETMTCMPCRISLPTADPTEATQGPTTYQDTQ